MTAATEVRATGVPSPVESVFANRNFRWLFTGGAISMLGDQFSLIALPWLVLRLTGDPLSLGLVLGLMSLPRAVFILIGGAWVDRYSSRTVLMLTKLVNTGLLGTLALLAWTGTVELWMVGGIALGIGLVTAFSFPAGSTILPQTLPPGLLPQANGLIMGLRQVSVLIGPLLAGVLVSLMGDHIAGHSVAGSLAGEGAFPEHAPAAGSRGFGLAFALDALSFAASAWMLTFVQVAAPAAARSAAPVMRAIKESMQVFWRDSALRTLCFYFAAIAFFVGGPIEVALPVLASTRLPGGAASLGLLLAGHGAGVLVGVALAGWRPRWRIRTLGTTVLVIDMLAGLVFMQFGRITAPWQGVVLLAPLGALAGFVQVAVFTWMQKRVPLAMLGRAMSLFMFIFMGLAPVASAAAGAALRVLSPATLFAASGAAMLVIAALGAVLTPIRQIRDVEQ